MNGYAFFAPTPKKSEGEWMHLDPETRIRVVIMDILPNIKSRRELGFYVRPDYIFELKEKVMGLAEQTYEPLLYEAIINEKFETLL